MHKDRRLGLLEEIGSQLCELDGENRSRRLAGEPPRTHRLEYIEVVFHDADRDELGRLRLALAIQSLAGDIYLFEDFDLNDAVTVGRSSRLAPPIVNPSTSVTGTGSLVFRQKVLGDCVGKTKKGRA
jgi:hypothetical protein